MTDKIRKMKKEDIAQIVELIKEHQVENGHKWIDLNSNGYYWMLASLFEGYSLQDPTAPGFLFCQLPAHP